MKVRRVATRQPAPAALRQPQPPVGPGAAAAVTQRRRESGSRCAFTKDGTRRILTERRQRKTCNAGDGGPKTRRGAHVLCPLLSSPGGSWRRPRRGGGPGGGGAEMCDVTVLLRRQAAAVSACRPVMSPRPSRRTRGRRAAVGEGCWGGGSIETQVTWLGGVTSPGDGAAAVLGRRKTAQSDPL